MCNVIVHAAWSAHHATLAVYPHRIVTCFGVDQLFLLTFRRHCCAVPTWQPTVTHSSHLPLNQWTLLLADLITLNSAANISSCYIVSCRAVAATRAERNFRTAGTVNACRYGQCLPVRSVPAGTVNACRYSQCLPVRSGPAGTVSACRYSQCLPVQSVPAGIVSAWRYGPCMPVQSVPDRCSV
jgi:hypothetical protein